MSLRQSRNPRPRQRRKSLRRLIDSGAVFLEGHKIDLPRRNAEILLAHILKKPLHYVYTCRDETASEELVREYTGMLRKRALHVPVQYITGEADFFGRGFFVEKGVLIPRPETEIMVEQSLMLYREYFEPASVGILDIGTGCGNIAVTLAAEITGCSVVATDVSARALKMACRNAALHGVDDRIEFERRNLFPAGENRFHIVVSNPPYIPHGDIPSLDEEVRKEPLRALDGGSGGTEVIRKIMEHAGEFLYDGGFLVMEIGYGQAEFVRNYDCVMNFIRVEKDLAGIERIAILRK